MILKSLLLSNFRNYQKTSFEFFPKVNLILGPNAYGKTNLLESVYLLATGRSFHASRNEEMINWGKSLAVVEAEIDGHRLKVALVKEGQRVAKRFWVDKVGKTRKEFLNQFSAVAFIPEEIRIISGSPSRRREFLDRIIAPLNWNYHQAATTYERALRRRNRLLDEIRTGRAGKQELYFWDQTLIKNGEIIRKEREKFLDFANAFFDGSSIDEFKHLSCEYKASPMTRELMASKLSLDLEFGFTSIGPHRDDFVILSSQLEAPSKNLDTWGSRGQQRLAVLALKLVQLQFAEKLQVRKPILLLDDIFSELDRKSRKLVSSVLKDYQALITATEAPEELRLTKNEETNIINFT